MRVPFPVVPALAFAVAAGCAPAPRLEVPAEIVSQTWSAPAALPALDEDLGLLIGGEELAALVERARAANPELRAARERVAAASALLKGARASALPIVSASAGAGAARSLSGGQLFEFESSFANLDASLTLDLFGREAARRRAARARARAAGFDADAAEIVVTAAVMRAFLQRATLARRLELTDTAINQAGETARILQIRRREGAATRVDVGLQQIRLRLAEAHDRTRTALAVLVGEEAPRFTLAAASLTNLSPPALGAPDPMTVLARRPDVQAAEARIRAAGGDVQAARRAFLPLIGVSLGASSGSGVNPAVALAQIGGEVLAPIFGRRRLNADLDAAAAGQREAVHQYRRAVLEALREVEDALSAIARSDERHRLLSEVQAEARITATLARRQYLEGDADLQRLLESQDLTVAAADALAVALQERIEARIALYAATARR
jgi:outer membrane protein, multidrug efflux system